MRTKSLLCVLFTTAVGVAEAQEYWQFGKPFRMYGVYTRKYGNPNTLFSSGNGEQYSNTAITFNQNSKNSYSDEAVANVEVIVSEVFYDGAPCSRSLSKWADLPIREDNLRKMNADQKLKALLGVTTRTIEVVADSEGRMKLFHSDHRDGHGRIQVWAKVNKDDIAITIENKQGTRKLSVTPGQGVEAFQNPIPAMLKVGDKDREPRKFCSIDPKTGGIIDYTVQYRTKFSGTIDRTKYSGFIYELSFQNQKRMLFVTEQGELLQVDYGNQRDYMNAVFTKDLSKPGG